MTFAPPGSTVSCPTVATAPSIPRAASRIRSTASAAATSASSRPAIGVVPACPARPLEDELAARVADDPRDDPERRVRLREHRALLDVHLEERGGQRRAAGHERAAADAADLLAAEDDDRARARPLDRVDRRHDAERAVEAAAVRDAVEVRSDPDPRRSHERADEVAVADRPPPPDPPRASTRRRARGPRPPRASRAGGWRPARRRSRTAARAGRGSARAESTSRAWSGSLAAERAEQPPAGEREHGRERRRPPARTSRRPQPRTPRAPPRRIAASTVCWMPIAAPLRRPPTSAAIVNESPFHAIDSRPSQPRGRARGSRRRRMRPPRRRRAGRRPLPR